MQDLLHEIVRRTDAGEGLGVCVVARTRGSTPQKAGAIMLVLESGETLGTLGGGCVEAEVRVRAQELLLRGEDRLLTFKLDHDYGWDDGLVCGGTMDIAVQAVRNAEQAELYRVAGAALAAGRPGVLRFTVPGPDALPVAVEQQIDPPAKLVIAGAGHVGGALAKVAAQLGFAVTVVDDRPDLATAERFPGATCVVGTIDHELRRLPMDASTYVVIVTRGHRHDAEALAAVIDAPVRYVGLIGSKRKVLTILRDLQASGVTEDRLARVHAPIGLAIGAVTPEEIAISIAAELVAVRRGATAAGGSMRLDPARIERWPNGRQDESRQDS